MYLFIFCLKIKLFLPSHREDKILVGELGISCLDSCNEA